MKRHTRRDPKKQGGKRGHRGSERRPSPMTFIDGANDACAEIAALAALLNAVGEPGDVGLEAINRSGYMIERQAARLHRCIASLNDWIAAHPWFEWEKGGSQ